MIFGMLFSFTSNVLADEEKNEVKNNEIIEIHECTDQDNILLAWDSHTCVMECLRVRGECYEYCFRRFNAGKRYNECKWDCRQSYHDCKVRCN